MFPVKYQFISPNSFRGDLEDVSISANQKQESSMAAMFGDGSEQNDETL